jgi:membrane fusion protein, multidrug efflux system
MARYAISEEIEQPISAAGSVSGRAMPRALAPRPDGDESAETPAQAEAQPLPPAAGPGNQPRDSKRKSRKILLAAASLIALSGALYFGWQYWTVSRFEVSTDDAYVKADNTTIAPRISGYLDTVSVTDNERVRAGQVLARIDERDFKVALDQARANVVADRSVIAGKEAAIEAQQSIIEAARATIAVDEANQTFAGQDDKRYATLAASGYGSVQNAQQAASRAAAARASTARDAAALANAIKQVDLLKAELGQAQATLARDEALQRQAELNLSYTTIISPIDGVVGNRTLRVGHYVQAGTQLMAVVPADAAYIIANYKETQLTDVVAGQKVRIEVDMFPGTTFYGHIDSLAPASGQEFALLPPDNATGNFTKVVQRIPVKITLDPGSPLAGRLRPGMSVYPTIETKSHEQNGRAVVARAQ